MLFWKRRKNCPDIQMSCCVALQRAVRERVCWPTPRTGAACTASSSWPSHPSSPLADWRRLSHLQMTSSHVDIRLMLLTSSKRGCRDSYSYSERLEALQETRFIGRGSSALGQVRQASGSRIGHCGGVAARGRPDARRSFGCTHPEIPQQPTRLLGVASAALSFALPPSHPILTQLAGVHSSSPDTLDLDFSAW